MTNENLNPNIPPISHDRERKITRKQIFQGERATTGQTSYYQTILGKNDSKIMYKKIWDPPFCPYWGKQRRETRPKPPPQIRHYMQRKALKQRHKVGYHNCQQEAHTPTESQDGMGQSSDQGQLLKTLQYKVLYWWSTEKSARQSLHMKSLYKFGFFPWRILAVPHEDMGSYG